MDVSLMTLWGEKGLEGDGSIVTRSESVGPLFHPACITQTPLFSGSLTANKQTRSRTNR